jgi:hypothetical protein
MSESVDDGPVRKTSHLEGFTFESSVLFRPRSPFERVAPQLHSPERR